MTERPRYYQPLTLPSYSMIWEAVLWVAFGRFPEGAGFEDEEELQGELGHVSFAWQDSFGGPRYRFKGFYWYEVELAGVDYRTIDWERYTGALRSGYEREDALRRHLADAENEIARDREDNILPLNRKRSDLYVQMCRNALNEQPYVESVHRRLSHQIDRAWSRIFDALCDEKLKGFGWGDLTQDEIRQLFRQGNLNDDSLDEACNCYNPWHFALPKGEVYGPMHPMGRCMEIPANEWALSGVAPDGRYISASGRQWWDVCFPTEDLFALFPRPLLVMNDANRDTLEMINPDLAMGSSKSNDSAKANGRSLLAPGGGPGRRKLADGQIEKLCHAVFGKRWLAGENKDSMHAEAAEIALRVWGETLKRSTFQGYMAAYSPKNKPVN